jgi:hypothetical protein
MARGSTAVKLAGTNFCLDAGSNPANGVQMKIWQVSAGSTVRLSLRSNPLRFVVSGKRKACTAYA